jgi:hypothetical protein
MVANELVQPSSLKCYWNHMSVFPLGLSIYEYGLVVLARFDKTSLVLEFHGFPGDDTRTCFDFHIIQNKPVLVMYLLLFPWVSRWWHTNLLLFLCSDKKDWVYLQKNCTLPTFMTSHVSALNTNQQMGRYIHLVVIRALRCVCVLVLDQDSGGVGRSASQLGSMWSRVNTPAHACMIDSTWGHACVEYVCHDVECHA